MARRYFVPEIMIKSVHKACSERRSHRRKEVQDHGVRPHHTAFVSSPFAANVPEVVITVGARGGA